MRINRVLFSCLLVALLAIAPSLSQGQSLLPGLGSLIGNGDGYGCYGECATGIAAPKVSVGYVCSKRVSGGASGTALGGLVSSATHELPYSGLWLEAELPVRLESDLSLSLSGTWLVPGGATSQETYISGATTPTRDWSVNHEWWSLTATGAYDATCALQVLGGFRYDKADLRFSSPDPDPAGAPSGLGAVTDEANTGLILYMPFVGLKGSVPSFDRGKLNLSVIGFPKIFGDVEYRETLGNLGARFHTKGNLKSGYFLEFSTDYSLGFMGADFGVFAKYTLAHGLASVNTQLDGIVIPSQTWEYSVDRSLWVIGGTFSLEIGSLL